jgi:hypothetical protein
MAGLAAAGQKDAAPPHVLMDSHAAEINCRFKIDFQLIIIIYYNSIQSKILGGKRVRY